MFGSILLLLIYSLLLNYAYLDFVTINYSYQGFIPNINNFKIVESNLMIVFIYIIFSFNNRSNTISNILITILITHMVVPFSILYSVENLPRELYYVFLFGFALTIVIARAPAIKGREIILFNHKSLIKFLIILSGITLLIIVSIKGFPTFQSFNFNNVYEIRNTNNFSRGISYLVNWQTKVISLFLISYFLYHKKYLLLGFTLIIQLLIYDLTAHKIILFAPLFLIGLYIVLRKIKDFTFFYIVLMNFAMVISISLYKFSITSWPADLFIRRMLLVPVKNTAYTYDYFSVFEKVKLSNSIFSGIFVYPLNKSIYYVIGEEYYGNALTNANASYIGDAYAQFGMIGIITYSILLGVILWGLKSIARNKPLPIILGTILISFYSIIDSSLLTSILTGGLFLGIILILFIQKDSDLSNIHNKIEKVK